MGESGFMILPPVPVFSRPAISSGPVGYNAPNQELAASNQQRRILIVAA
jgi:hypothetical protein